MPGRTRFERLLLIGITSTYLSADALKAAVQEAKTGRDIKRYIEAQAQLRSVAPHEPEATKDQTWVDGVDRENQAKTALLEANLKSYKNNLIKESVRVGLLFSSVVLVFWNLGLSEADQSRWATRI